MLRKIQVISIEECFLPPKSGKGHEEMTNGEEVLNYISLHSTLNCFTSYVNNSYLLNFNQSVL